MNTIGATHILPPPTASFHAPVGKPPVGLETPDSKNAALPPVEETAAEEKLRGDKSHAADPDGGRGSGGQQGAPRDDAQQEGTAVPSDPASAAVTPPPVEPPLGVAGLMRALALAAADSGARNAIRAFDEVQHEHPPSAPHLDQRA